MPSVYRMFLMPKTPSLAKQLRKLADEMKENDRRQRELIETLLMETQDHLEQLERHLKR